MGALRLGSTRMVHPHGVPLHNNPSKAKNPRLYCKKALCCPPASASRASAREAKPVRRLTPSASTTPGRDLTPSELKRLTRGHARPQREQRRQERKRDVGKRVWRFVETTGQVRRGTISGYDEISNTFKVTYE